MALNLGGWIHSFTVTDTQTHKKGYTIYKITSVVFPRSVPQALTCLVVWKRFHEIKRLHRELVRRHKSLQLPGRLPEPTDSSYFKRFDNVVIQKRKEYILQLFDFVAQHPALYKCNSFAQFFNDAQSPQSSPIHKLYVQKRNIILHNDSVDDIGHRRDGAIAEICDNLDLPYDPHDGIILLDPTRDKPTETNNDKQADNCVSSNDGQLSDVHGCDVKLSTEMVSTKDCTRFLTPMASIESDDSDYIYEAALEFSYAVQAEVNLEYETAHKRYKRGVDLLLYGCKDDPNDERKSIAKAKISKYLARADEIYERFLRDSNMAIATKQFQLSLDVVDNSSADAIYLERPWNNLAKYKVLQVLGERVMQVQCVTSPQHLTVTYIMKGIEKPSSHSLTQSIFLPQKVPYMVELLAFFQSEQKIFLLLKQAEGGLLYEYIQSYTPNGTEKTTNYAQLFPAVSNNEIEDEFDYMDLGFGEPHLNAASSAVSCKNDFSELVRHSQALLQSVSNTLLEVQTPTKSEPESSSNMQTSERSITSAISKRKIPEASLKQWACELALAIHSLHEKGIILCDLNMSNILLGSKGQLLLSYFYQHEALNADNGHVHKAWSIEALAGHFVAPERPLSFKSDWWSYGVVLYQLLLCFPFNALHPGQIDLYGCIQYPDNIEISDNARDLLDNLLQGAPESRYDYAQIQAHAFFDGIDWQQLHENGLINGSKQQINI